ncbi:hypothetical protein IQ255_21095 [Pleurocapsales cyanobacterium LEGE 10410]|nr:hypothetical protein [Pleurocapsales cyanobacterium LEGE 10410]
MFDETIVHCCQRHSITLDELLSKENVDKLEGILEQIENRFGEEVANLLAIILFEETCREDSDFKEQTFYRLKQELTKESYQKAEKLFTKVKLEKLYLETEEPERELIRILTSISC